MPEPRSYDRDVPADVYQFKVGTRVMIVGPQDTFCIDCMARDLEDKLIGATGTVFKHGRLRYMDHWVGVKLDRPVVLETPFVEGGAIYCSEPNFKPEELRFLE